MLSVISIAEHLPYYPTSLLPYSPTTLLPITKICSQLFFIFDIQQVAGK
ncbi:MAG: hypothetical protein SWX82_29265 [Cyanobacteriota bacterium]|nr:hypothetical protein [Cyanobacteriota bacterium]